jgi:hypothetical protein
MPIRPLPVRAIPQSVQQLPGILEVAAPQQAHTLAGETIGRVGVHAVIGELHLLRRRGAPFGLPVRAVRHAVLGPLYLREGDQKDSSGRR